MIEQLAQRLYQQKDIGPVNQVQYDCFALVNDVLGELLPVEPSLSGFAPLNVADAADLVSYGFLRFSPDPPSPSVHPYQDPHIVFYMEKMTGSAPPSDIYREDWINHVGLYYGYTRRSNQTELQIISKAGVGGDVYIHPLHGEVTDEYGTKTVFLRGKDFIEQLQRIEKHGMRSMDKLRERYLAERRSFIKHGISLQDADKYAKRLLVESCL